MQTYEQVQAYYQEMLATWIDPGEDVTVERINRALANWHAVGCYLTDIARQFDSKQFMLEQELENSRLLWYEEATQALKFGQPTSFNPTVRAIEAKIADMHRDELLPMIHAARDAKRDAEAVASLRKMHDRYPSVLNTLSSNMRTDFLYASGNGSVAAQAVSQTKTEQSMQLLKEDL